LINYGGNILSTLFGTATTNDIHLLPETLDISKTGNLDITHSLSGQITHIKTLDTVRKINTNTIANFLHIVKYIAIQTLNRFQ
jgi:hypothetical protein